MIVFWLGLPVVLAMPLLLRRLAREGADGRPASILAWRFFHAVNAALWLGWAVLSDVGFGIRHPGVHWAWIGVGFLWTEAWVGAGPPTLRRLLRARLRSPLRVEREDTEISQSEALGPELDEAIDPRGEDRNEESESDSESERRMVTRIAELGALAVERVMTPRDRILHLDGGVTVAEALATLRAARRSRLVVVEGSLDRILGIAHAKDLVPLQYEGGRALRHHLRRWLSVPPGRTVSGLLEDFRRNRVHLGIVSGRDGKTAGLVTVRDLFTAILDEAEEPA